MAKITVSFVRSLLSQLEKEQISFSRMVEMLNEKANQSEQAWAAGAVTCSICTHAWVAARPANTTKLECPNCGNFSEVEEN